MFSRRVPSTDGPNELTRRLRARRAQGAPIVDLTLSNPTRAGIAYPATLLAPLADAAALRYEPEAFGLPAARSAVAADHARRGATVDPEDVVLTASTSEAYTWLFKLLCNPGESVLVPQPSYPLFEHLTMLEGIAVKPYQLEYHGRWQVELEAVAAAGPETRAVLMVSPNNPTGSYVTRDEYTRVAAICAERGWALIVDEVFADYRLEAATTWTDVAARDVPCLAFTLGGLSKSVGLPQLKLGWMIVGGPSPLRRDALNRLELIADSFLSVGTPVQVAAASLLAAGGAIREAIAARVAGNLAALRRVAAEFPACDVLRTEGGWSAVIRVPALRAEEDLVLELLERDGILVHPGYFFDFRQEAYVVVSLLPAPDVFADAVPRLLTRASAI